MRIDGVLVHWDPPVPAGGPGARCGELGEQHVDVWFHLDRPVVEVYLSGYTRPQQTYRQDAWAETIQPVGRVARLLGDSLLSRIHRSAESRARLLRQRWAEEAEQEAARQRGPS